MIRKVFIPNRGEIAVRIIKAARVLGIKTVVALWRSEQSSLAVQLADEVYWWPTPTLSESYLNPKNIVDAALGCGADAVHPGYGFLSENYLLAEACEQSGLVFVGPRSAHLLQMGDKTRARELAKQAGIPVVEGWDGNELLDMANKHHLPFPLLIKAAMGGGGKAMHVVETHEQLNAALEQAQGEALRYFGDARVFVEKYIPSPRHIEVQLLADQHGNTIHLGERECSIQRRHQKIVEEAPAPNLPREARQAICADAVRLAQSIGYVNAGTIEFLVDAHHRHYFLEMNTRIQVEHAVTEAVTGIDLVVEQFRIANNQQLSVDQSQVQFTGHAIETRIYAEDPLNGFAPSPGNISVLKWPADPHIRIDTSLHQPCAVLPDFDPMLAKVVTHGATRQQAIDKQIAALKQCVVMGIATNMAYLLAVLAHPTFIDGLSTTHFCDRHHHELIKPLKADVGVDGFAAFALWKLHRIAELMGVKPVDAFYRWVGKFLVEVNQKMRSVVLSRTNNHWQVDVEGDILVVDDVEASLHSVAFSKCQFWVNANGNGVEVFADGLSHLFVDLSLLPKYVPYGKREKDHGNTLLSPIPGRIVKVNVSEGQQVAKGETIVVLEAMKMETHLKAWKDATIESIHVAEGNAVGANQLLVTLSTLQ